MRGVRHISRVVTVAGIGWILGAAGWQNSYRSEAEIAQATERFARCIVSRRPDQARIIVAESLGSAEVAKRFPSFLDERCIDADSKAPGRVHWQFPHLTLHQMMAGLLVRRDYAAAGPSTFQSVAPLPAFVVPPKMDEADRKKLHPLNQEAVLRSEQTAAAWAVLQPFGECVARANPEGVRSLALTDAASDGEEEALKALQPLFGGCLPAGVTFKMRGQDVRGSSVLAYYRLARLAPSTPTRVPL